METLTGLSENAVKISGLPEGASLVILPGFGGYAVKGCNPAKCDGRKFPVGNRTVFCREVEITEKPICGSSAQLIPKCGQK